MLLLSLTAISCATVTRGSTQSFTVTSEPSGATVTTSNGLVGITPVTFEVSRKRGFMVRVEKAGYEPAEVHVAPRVHGAGGAAMAGNILAGGLIGAAVDSSTGAMYDLEPNPVSVILQPITTSMGPPSDDRDAATIERAQAELEAIARAVIQHRSRYGEWPASLAGIGSIIVRETNPDLRDPWGTPYRYALDPETGGFFVAAAGSDRVFDPSSWSSSPMVYESLRPDAVVRGSTSGEVVLARRWASGATSR